jgi:dolichol kinase
LFETEQEEENWRGLGAQTLVLGAILTIFFFGKEVVVPALLVLSISDAVSAICGTYIKSAVILERRTVFGTTSFFVSALMILIFFVPPLAAIVVAIVAALVELIPLPDDNIWIPLATAALLSFIMPFI